MPIMAPPPTRSSERRDIRIPAVTESSTPPTTRADGYESAAVVRAHRPVQPAVLSGRGKTLPNGRGRLQMWWIGLGGPRSGRTVMPVSRWKATSWKVARAMGVTTGPGGSTAGGTAQKTDTQVGAMAGEAGASCCQGHAGQPFASAVGLLKAAPSCGISIGIGMATAAIAWPRIPMPKATRRVSARSRASLPWNMGPQIAPGAAWFKLALRPTARQRRSATTRP
jgi:hypothetical protein